MDDFSAEPFYDILFQSALHETNATIIVTFRRVFFSFFQSGSNYYKDFTNFKFDLKGLAIHIWTYAFG